MANPAHHVSTHSLLTSKKSKQAVSVMAYVVGVGGNIAVVPQIIKAWQSDAPGLAISTWLLFTLIGIIWLIYALQNKQKPLIVAQTVGITCNLAVVLGWAYNYWR